MFEFFFIYYSIIIKKQQILIHVIVVANNIYREENVLDEDILNGFRHILQLFNLSIE